ncbi:TIGR02328 family protein [Enterococcus sp. DIV0800]|uniref:TIGR02328 family protein n=1 Tax=unclassified Enterococcus TaxID=2608891 RepID=UPI003D2FF02E
MRLWHEALIPALPRQQLLGQHREVAALRGKGWGKKHATVDYVFTHPYYKLYQFHLLVLEEMKRRGYKPDSLWFDPLYRGKNLSPLVAIQPLALTRPIYPEHNEDYLTECLLNLAQKGIFLTKP